jgi:hypothetical protein
MENKFDLKQFYEKEKINEMKLDENLTMFDIYEELKLKNIENIYLNTLI